MIKIKEWFDLKEPKALTIDEWYGWEKTTKAARPVAYFAMRTFPDACDYIWCVVSRPYKKLTSYLRYRFIARYHVIPTGLRPDCYDIDTRMLNGMFNMLVGFVEKEKAWMNVALGDDKAKRKKLRWGWRYLGISKYGAFRDPAEGLDHLRWEMSLDSPSRSPHDRNESQAHVAREIWDLYHWWKHIRPKRPEPYDVSGWSDHCENNSWKDTLRSDHTPEEREHIESMLKEVRSLEEIYDDEDEKQLIRLIKIRKSLWT